MFVIIIILDFYLLSVPIEVVFLFVIYDVDDSHLTFPVSLQLSLHHEAGREALSLDVSLDVAFDLHR